MVNGLYSILYIDIGEGFKPIACLTENSFSENVEMLPTTTRDNAGWKTSVPTMQGYNLTFSGIAKNTIYGGDTTKYSYDVLKIIKRNKGLIDWKISNLINGDLDYGKGYITSLDSSYVIDEFISFNGQIEGFGVPITTNETPLDLGLESILEALI